MRSTSALFSCLCLFGAATAVVFIPETAGRSHFSSDMRRALIRASTKPRLAARYGRLPLGFEVNQGQTDPQVKFLARGHGYTLFLNSTEAVVSLKKQGASHTRAENPKGG